MGKLYKLDLEGLQRPLNGKERTDISQAPTPNTTSSGGSKQDDSITLANDVMFGLVMRDSKLLTPLLRDIMGKPDLEIIGDIVPQSAVTIAANKDVSVRFDVYCKSGEDFIDVEVQTTRESTVLQRARMYSSVLDATRQTTRGKAHNRRYELVDTWVIFLCSDRAFPGGYGDCILRGETLYSNQSGLSREGLIDGRHYVFVNYDAPQLDLCGLHYLTAVCNAMTKTATQRYTDVPQEYDQAIAFAMQRDKFNSEEWSAMLSAEEKRRIREESLEEGREEGVDILVGAISLIAKGATDSELLSRGYSPSVIAKARNCREM